MKTLWHVALHDLRLHLADKSNIFFLLLMPIGFVFFFALVNPTRTDTVQVALPVVDHDGEFLSIAFAEQLRSENFAVQVHDTASADTTSFATRHVVIPDSFTARVLAGERTDVTLSSRSRSDTSYDLAGAVRLHLAQVRFLGNLVRWSADADSGALDPATLDAAEMGRFLALVAEPSRVTVESRNAGTGRPVPSGTRQSIPGVLVMFVVMTVLIGGSEALTREKLQGTLRRLVTTPLSARQVLVGKTLGLTLLGLAQAVVLIVVTDVMSLFGIAGLDFRWAPYLPGLAALLVVFCACIAALGLLASALLRTPQQAESLAWLFGMAMSALGGAWWPLEVMPESMQLTGRFFPTAWAMDGLHGVISYGAGIASTLVPILVLTAMTLLFWILGSRLMRVSN